MPKLTDKDFKYYKQVVLDDEKDHQTKMMSLNLPDEVIAMYEGRYCDQYAENGFAGVKDYNENYLFIAANTVTPTLFYQVPRPIVRGKRGQLKYSAAVIDGLVRFYLEDDWKEQNQLAIIDAFLAYGYGVMRVGYNSRTARVNNKPNILTGETSQDKNANQDIEDNPEYIKYEKPVLIRHSPKYTYLDHTKPFGQDTKITFIHKRTLQELIDSNLYSLGANFLSYFASRNDDNRLINFDKVYEHFCMIGDYCHKLVYIDEWNEPLYWGKTPYKELPRALLRFVKTPDRLYTVAHGYLAYKAQKELNYLNGLWKEHIDKMRRQHLIDETGLTGNGLKAIKTNDIDGIIGCTRPPSTVYQQITSQPMSKDAYANIDNVRNYLKLLLSVSGGRGGESEADFATTEKAQAQGDFMRMGGLQDSIRDFVRKQIRMTVGNIVRLGSPDITIKISGKDVIDPITHEMITGRELKIGGDNGLILQDEIKGDIDKDYLFDVDITSAARPDFAVIRKQLADAIALSASLRPLMQEKGKDLDIPEMIADYFNTFDTIPNPDKYIVEMTPEEKQMMAMKAQMAMGGGMPLNGAKPPISGSVPTEEAITRGASNPPDLANIGALQV